MSTKDEAMEKIEFGQFGPEHFEKIKKGVELYNQKRYWECHEELEDHWLEDTYDNARFVYWAIIQASTALYHYEDKNIEGARGQITKAQDKLARCEKMGVETSYLEKQLSWNSFKMMVRKIKTKCELNDFDELYEFKFPLK